MVEALITPSTSTHEWDSDDGEKVLAPTYGPSLSPPELISSPNSEIEAPLAPAEPGEDVCE